MYIPLKSTCWCEHVDVKRSGLRICWHFRDRPPCFTGCSWVVNAHVWADRTTDSTASSFVPATRYTLDSEGCTILSFRLSKRQSAVTKAARFQMTTLYLFICTRVPHFSVSHDSSKAGWHQQGLTQTMFKQGLYFNTVSQNFKPSLKGFSAIFKFISKN